MAHLAFLITFMILSSLPGTLAVYPQPEYPQFENKSRVYLSPDRGYKDVLVAIGEYVAEDPELITRIREVFRDLSSFLYSATNEYGSGVYFEEIRILIPDTWSNDPSYETRTWESFGASDIQIDHPPDNTLRNRNQPSTSKPTHCGAPGLYIHLTPDYMTNDGAARVYGDRNRTLTHEWAHYRWGVFDEYPTQGYSHFYPGENGQYEATKCVAGITGRARRPNGDPCTYDAFNAPDDECRFLDDDTQTGTYEGSLMYKQFLPKMRTFCDSPSHTTNAAITHNAMATNQQNDLCSSKSIWEVLREHRDFQNVAPVNQQPNLAPAFRLIKRQESRSPIVLVLDVSGSMGTEQRLHVLRQASYNLITRVLNNGQVFGAVVFNSMARTVIDAQVIISERESLTADLPNSAGGDTSIGAGVRQGILTLQGYTGIEMLVLTDGDENEPPYLRTLTDFELSGITVHTIAIGPNADSSLEQLAVRTGGRTFEHSDKSAALFNIFTDLAVQDGIGTLTILSEPFTLEDTVRRFSVDSFSEGNITVLVGFPKDLLGQYEVSVTKPNGDVIDVNARPPDSYRSVPSFDLVQIDTESIAGDWKIFVNTTSSTVPTTLTGTMHVETKRNLRLTSSGTPVRPPIPINADAQWALSNVEPSQIQTVAVTVHQGYTPVSGANATVTVIKDSISSVILSAYDDGLAADVKANDGVYSAFFTQFSGTGRYSLQVTVRGTAGKTKLMEGSRVGQGLAAYNPNLLPEFKPREVDTGSFERSIEGNSFVCTGASCQGTTDVYSPFRIRDLRAVRGDNLTAVLTFTATGDDLDYGTADYYELRMSTDHHQMVERFSEAEALEYIPADMRTNETLPPYVISGNLSSPKESRMQEVFHVKLPAEGDFSYVFGVVAVDDQGLRSQPSNLASLTAVPPPPTRKPVTVTQQNEFQTSVPNPQPGFPVIVGTLLPLLCLVVLVLLAFLFIKRRRSKRSVRDEEALGTAMKEDVPRDALQYVRGSSEGDEIANAYRMSNASQHNADDIRGADKVYTNKVGGVDNLAFNQEHQQQTAPNDFRSPLQRTEDSKGYDSDDDTIDYENVPKPQDVSFHSMEPQTATTVTSLPPALPKKALSPPPRQVQYQPKPVPRSRPTETTEDLIYDDAANDQITNYDGADINERIAPVPGMRDTSIYPFVSLGHGSADETHTAYQFTRVPGTSVYAIQQANKVYAPQQTTTNDNDNSSDDDGDYEPVPDPNSSGDQIMNMMENEPDSPPIPLKAKNIHKPEKKALQPPKPVPRARQVDPPTRSDGHFDTNFLSELSSVISPGPIVPNNSEVAGGLVEDFPSSKGPLSVHRAPSVEDHDYDDAPSSKMPFGMAEDDDDSDKDDYEFVNDPHNLMPLGLNRS